MSTILGAFNNHFIEFLEDVSVIFPKNREIRSAKTALEMLKKANPRAIIKMWKIHITGKYKEQILKGDISYFLTKNYNDDIKGNVNENKIMAAIDKLRGPISQMGEDNQKKSMKYIQNLTKISELYNK